MRLVYRVVAPALLIICILFGFTLVRGYFTSSPQFAVASIDVEGESPEQDLLVREQLNHIIGQNIFLIPIAELKATVEGLPRIRHATVSRSLPASIQVRYSLQKPIAILQFGRLYYVNFEGDVYDHLKVDDNKDFPLIQLSKTIKRMEDLPREYITAALNLLQEVQSSTLLANSDLNDIYIEGLDYNGRNPIRFTLQYPPKKLRSNSRSFDYLNISLGIEDASGQVRRIEKVLRYLVKMKQKPKQIRLELGKKVVVKIAQ